MISTPITMTMTLSAATDTPPSAETLTVVAGPDHAGLRVDRFLAEAIGSLSRSRVKALIIEGAVSRDGVPMRDASEASRPGSTYAVRIPAAVAAIPLPQDIPLTILFEDRDLIVLDKPAGLVVHPAPGNQDGTLVNALLAHAGEDLPGIGGEKRPGIVHRLDKDTSGVMVVAKTEQALRSLSETFASRDLDREYLALVWGLPQPAARGGGGRHRPPSGRSQAHGRGRTQRQACAHPLRHRTRLGHRLRPAPLPAGHRPHAPDPRAPRARSATLWWAIRCTFGGSPPPPAAGRTGPRHACWPFRVRPCMPRRWVSAIRSAAHRCASRRRPPADFAGLLERELDVTRVLTDRAGWFLLPPAPHCAEKRSAASDRVPIDPLLQPCSPRRDRGRRGRVGPAA